MEKIKKLTKIEIIDFVVNHFKSNPRAVTEDGDCAYLTEDGYRCAHSICIKDEMVEACNKTTGSCYSVILEFGDKVHKKEFQGHEPSFWSNIQSLHDENLFWKKNKSGGCDLTKRGIDYVNILKAKHK